MCNIEGEMKLYFWDWNSSLTIERCEMDFPFLNNDDAAKSDCFTNLESAKLAAKIDLRGRIAELQRALDEIDRINPNNVTTVKFIHGT